VSLGERVKAALKDLQKRFQIIGDVRGLGLMIGAELVKSRETKEPAVDETRELVKKCYEKGLIVLSCGVHHNVIRTLIPMIIADEQLEKGLEILGESFEELA
jgi:4-aminobutyrate aminotransferase/(S)-3-amino-2-methylpropionate transaminase